MYFERTIRMCISLFGFLFVSLSSEISLINVRSVVNRQPHHNALHATFDSHSTSNGRMVKLLINK